MKWEALRRGQAAAVETIRTRYIADEPYTAVVLPTRYGKTDVMRVASVLLWQDGLMPCALGLSPNVVLRDQMGDAKRWREALARYELNAPDLKIRKLKQVEADPTANGEMFLSVTTQMVQRNLGEFRDWVDSMVYRTGRRPIVFVDECHTGSEDNEWGEAVRQLVDAGARAVLLTATAIRSDGKRIPGFACRVIEEEEISVRLARPGSEPELVRIELYEGMSRLIELIPDHSTTFAEAWEDDVILNVGHIPFDIDLSKLEGEDVVSGTLLSELKNTRDVRKTLGRVVRSRIAIREGVSRLVLALQRVRPQAHDAAAIVFCGNDDDKEDPSVNKHANQIKQEILALDPDLKVVIATHADAGGERLQAFQDGIGDILIVKQMAGVGLDVPRLKIGLDLSPVRTPAAYIQRMMRIATPYRHFIVCTWICPADILAAGLYEDLVERGGGAARGTELEMVSWYEKPREDKTTPIYVPDAAAMADIFDTRGNFAGKDRYPVAEAILNAYPAITALYSHAEVANRADLFRITPVKEGESAMPAVRDTEADTAVLRHEINDLADDIATTRSRMGEYDRDEWVELRRQGLVGAYRAANIPRGVELKDVTSIRTLKVVKATLMAMLTDMGRGVR